MRAKAVLFLEPQNANMLVVKRAKDAGYATLGLTMSHEHLKKTRMPYRAYLTSLDHVGTVLNWSDVEAVLTTVTRLEERYEIVGVYTSVDIALNCSAVLRQRLGLPTNTEAMLKLTRDKHKLREALAAAGLTKLRSLEQKDIRPNEPWPFPSAAYFKPRSGSGSICVHRCKDWSDYAVALTRFEAHAKNFDKTWWISSSVTGESSFYLEQEHAGELLSVEALVDSGEVHVLGITGRNLYSKNPIIELGSLFPHQHRHAEAIVNKAKAILRAVGYEHGAAHIEMIVDVKGEVELVDLNCRFVGADVLLSMNEAYGTQIEDYLLKLAVGEPLTGLSLTPRRFCVIQSFFMPSIDGILESIEFPDDPALFGTQCRIDLGTPLSAEREEHSVGGCFMVSDQTIDAAQARAKALKSLVRINGTYGIDY